MISLKQLSQLKTDQEIKRIVSSIAFFFWHVSLGSFQLHKPLNDTTEFGCDTLKDAQY